MSNESPKPDTKRHSSEWKNQFRRFTVDFFLQFVLLQQQRARINHQSSDAVLQKIGTASRNFYAHKTSDRRKRSYRVVPWKASVKILFLLSCLLWFTTCLVSIKNFSAIALKNLTFKAAKKKFKAMNLQLSVYCFYRTLSTRCFLSRRENFFFSR